MGFTSVNLKMPTDFSEEELRAAISRKLNIKEFTYAIDLKSLDARRKQNIVWQIRAGVNSPELQGRPEQAAVELEVPRSGNGRTALIAGSGPAGLFAAIILQKAGFTVTVIERGSQVHTRAEAIRSFEAGGRLNPNNNYAFGEGGAGTFSDGKLTARSKRISAEKRFIMQTLIGAGAPPEIEYLAHPHLGTDNLQSIIISLREKFIEQGGEFVCDCLLDDIHITDGRITSVSTGTGDREADIIILAPGHSSFGTYRMLINRGVLFQPKNFAIGCRVEHPQELINEAQWGCKSLSGVKAAEYRLTHNPTNQLPVYTFCMCPGGIVVPATAYEHTNIVNGMSHYARGGRFANAACVAGVQPDRLLDDMAEPSAVLDWLEALEARFYTWSGGYKAPACTIRDFLDGTESGTLNDTSYPLGLSPAPLRELFPGEITGALIKGLQAFTRKLKGFDTGIMLGLESKTSAPIQAVRDEQRRCEGFSNLYIAGEGSGHSGGIISSAADGIKTAMAILGKT